MQLDKTKKNPHDRPELTPDMTGLTRIGRRYQQPPGGMSGTCPERAETPLNQEM